MTPVITHTSKKSPGAWDDARLVKECVSGNEEAWSLLIEKYKALIYSIPVKYGLPPHEAADVFQSTCMELLTRLPQLREPRALPKWLMQVAHHQCYRWKRQQRRVVSRDAEPDLPVPETPAIAESLVQQTQEEQMLREAMAFLTPQRNWVLPWAPSGLPGRNALSGSGGISMNWDSTDASRRQETFPGRTPLGTGAAPERF